MDYWNTYSTVVSWNNIRLMLVMALINDCHMQPINFVLIPTQAHVKNDLYIKPPKVTKEFEIPDLPNFTENLT